eukprot:2224506-Amphidinium_carterae.1
MACGDILWAMPPNPPLSNRLACEYLPSLALRRRHTVPVCEGDANARDKLAKFWLQHGGVVSFGIAVEQLAVSNGC